MWSQCAPLRQVAFGIAFPTRPGTERATSGQRSGAYPKGTSRSSEWWYIYKATKFLPCYGPPLIARSPCCSYDNKPFLRVFRLQLRENPTRTSLNCKVNLLTDIIEKVSCRQTWLNGTSEVTGDLVSGWLRFWLPPQIPLYPPSTPPPTKNIFRLLSHRSSDSHSLKGPHWVTDSFLNYLSPQAQEGLIGLSLSHSPKPCVRSTVKEGDSPKEKVWCISRGKTDSG